MRPHEPDASSLMLGMIALNLNFISREQFDASFGHPSVGDSPPGEPPLASGHCLSAEQHDFLKSAVLDYLGRQAEGHDRGLDESTLSHLAPVAGPDAFTAMPSPEVEPAEGSAGDCVGLSESTGKSRGRYRVERLHAKGGLGEVYRARDLELGREVALKEIRARHADDLARRARFLLEAEITGNLEHPGIIPIYGIGRHDDGRPYYVMRFIDGEELGEAVTRFHAAGRRGDDPGARSLAIRGLLRRFLDVCNAIDYAHGRGIIHRDLKPSNVMLGPHGETLVVDWGLAKWIGAVAGAGAVSGAGDDSVVEGSREMPRPSRGDEASRTLAGSAIGTPGYMSPEQAAGLRDRVGPASDIYGLGAILYQILTGRAPFEEPNWSLARRQILEGDFPRPRQVSRDVPAALEAICLKALATEAVARYPSARALADDVEKWMADEPVSAHREPWSGRVRRQARRHRVLVTSSAATILMASTLIGIGWARAEATRHDAVARVVAAREKLERRRELARESSGDPTRWEGVLATARALRELATSLKVDRQTRADADRLAAGVEGEARGVRLERELLEELDQIRAGEGDTQAEENEAAYERAFQLFGLDPDDPATVYALRAKAPGRPEAARIAMASGLDRWAIARRAARGRETDWRTLVELAARVDPDPIRVRLRRAWVDGERAMSGEAMGIAQIDRLEPASLTLLARRRVDEGDRNAAERLLRRGLLHHPFDVWLNFDLAELLACEGTARRAEAIEHYRVAWAKLPSIGRALAYILEGEARHEDAEAIFRQLLRSDGESPRFASWLGRFLGRRHRTDEARDVLGRATAGYREVAESSPDSALAWNNLGNSLADLNDLEGAIAAYHRAIAAGPEFLPPLRNLGLALMRSGDPFAAADTYRRALLIRPESALTLQYLAEALEDLGDLGDATDALRVALEAEPDNAEARCALGWTLRRRGLYREALAELERGHELGLLKPLWPHRSRQWADDCRRSLALEERLPMRLDPDTLPEGRKELLDLGRVLFEKSRFEESAIAYREAFRDYRGSNGGNPSTQRSRAALAAIQTADALRHRDGGDPAAIEAEAKGWRELALRWIGAELAISARAIEKGSPKDREDEIRRIRLWRLNPDLGPVRDDRLDRLPAEERDAWIGFWDETNDALNQGAPADVQAAGPGQLKSNLP